MARNEVEVFFDNIRQRHQDEAVTLLTQQAEFIRRGDLDIADTLDEPVQTERGRIRFLNQFVPKVLTDLKSQGIRILEVEETAQVAAAEKVILPAEEEKIPEILITPDGTEIGGINGKLLAFLAHKGTFKDRVASARHVYGQGDHQQANRVTTLIGDARNEQSKSFKHGVRIETKEPAVREKQQGVRAQDRVVFAAEVAEMLTPRLQAAVLANVMLTAYDRNPEGLQQNGVNPGQAGIRELQDIRQQGGVIKPELKSRLMRECQDLLSRFLADASTVYDELAKNPDDKDILIALTHFAPLAQSGERMFDQLFKEL